MSRPKAVILNIDDDAAGRYAVSRVLRQGGYEVLEAATGETGLRMASSHRPDFILLDVRLPDIDGFEVCRRIRDDPQISGIPVVQMSASYRDTTSRVKGLQNGADGYLTEPVEPAILLATVQSLMRMKKAERTVRLAAAQWQSTFDAIGEGVALLDSEGMVVQTNAAYAKIAGAAGAQIAGAVSSSFERLRASGQRQTAEVQVGESTLAFTLDPVRGTDGEFTGGVCVATDVTEKRRFDQHLRQTARLESIGVLAGGIAHDFNNLLTGILGNSTLLMDTLPPDSPELGMVNEIVKASESAADLTRQILAYSGKGRLLSVPVDLSAIALASRAFVRSFVPPHVELTYDIGPGSAIIMGDAGQMQQLTMNLIINAAESFEPGARGTVRVEVRVEQLSADFFRPEEQHAPGEYVCLVVSDTGSGMDPATQARIFDPFFTTKFAGRGLGLSAVHGILQGHNGFLRLESRRGAGTTFRIYFPATRERRDPSEQPARKMPERGTGTILVVDDESVVRTFTKRALEGLGYEVRLAESGQDALDQLGSSDHRVVLVILDLTMPGMEGEETLERIHLINPEIPVVLSSGFNLSTALERFRGKRLAGFLGKPYSSAELAETVESVLRGKAPGKAAL